MIRDISVVIPTFNRAQELNRTLEGMIGTEKGDLSIEFVVVDNGCTDQTKSIVDSFSSRLRVRYIFEPRPGKSRALNTVLEKGGLGNIVVFTDDDVDPSREWLVAIASACGRWPNHSVFGGRINVSFSIENVPKFAFDPYISSIGFACHNYSNDECLYKDGQTPFGANFWVKRKVLDNGRRFNEGIGAFATGMIFGEDTLFLLGLQGDGYEIVYSPRAMVTHRVRPELLKLSKIYQRAYRHGRGMTHIYGLPVQSLLTRFWPGLSGNSGAWRLYRNGSIALYAFKVLTSFIFSSNDQRPGNVVRKMRELGYRVEALRLAKQVLAQSQEQS